MDAQCFSAGALPRTEVAGQLCPAAGGLLRGWGLLVVTVTAFAAYALSATPAPYLLDSAELAAATFGLGVAHPPGEVTAVLWGKAFDLTPLGNVAFRAAIAQACAGALAAGLVFTISLHLTDLIDDQGRLGHVTRVLVATAAALIFAFAPGVIIVSDRAEVYALQTALSLASLHCALLAAQTRDCRPALVAAVLLALGVANHSLVAGLAGLGAVSAALPLLRDRALRTRLVVVALLAFATGLAIHAYLPVRAAAMFAAPDRGASGVVWGDARSWKGLWWVLSAKTFVSKQSVVQDASSPADLPFLPMEELGVAFVLLAPAGIYLLLRRQRSRWTGISISVATAGSLAAGLIGGLAPANPDIRGYLGPAFALLAVLGTAGLAFGLMALRPHWLRLTVAGLLAASALARFPSPGRYPGLRRASAADAVAGELLSELPPRAALLTNQFETAFVVGYQRLVEARRPDVAWAHLPFVGGPGYAERVAAAEPALATLLHDWRAGTFSTASLLSVDSTRPVRLEPDALMPRGLHLGLVPSGRSWALAGRSQVEVGQAWEEWLLDNASRDRQLRGYLGWLSYLDAVWACDLGMRQRLQLRVAELDRLMPLDIRHQQLKARCAPSSPAQ